MVNATFNLDFLSEASKQAMSMSYSEFAKRMFPPAPKLTPKIIKLSRSTDPRKTKRAWRLYYKLNGKDAPAYGLYWVIGTYRTHLAFKNISRGIKSLSETLISRQYLYTPQEVQALGEVFGGNNEAKRDAARLAQLKLDEEILRILQDNKP